jgi:nitrogen PTS system EIIA component
MRISEFLKLESIDASLTVSTKTEAIKSLAQRCGQLIPHIHTDRIVAVFEEREKLGSTGMEKGVAIPHGRMSELPFLVASFGRSQSGISFDSRDGLPAHFFFALLAPENSAGLHLKALSKISRLFRSDAFRESLMGAPDAKAIYELICAEDARA